MTNSHWRNLSFLSLSPLNGRPTRHQAYDPRCNAVYFRNEPFADFVFLSRFDYRTSGVTSAFDPIETVETLASPAKVWVFKLSGIHRKINLVKSGKQEHRD